MPYWLVELLLRSHDQRSSPNCRALGDSRSPLVPWGCRTECPTCRRHDRHPCISGAAWLTNLHDGRVPTPPEDLGVGTFPYRHPPTLPTRTVRGAGWLPRGRVFHFRRRGTSSQV